MQDNECRECHDIRTTKEVKSNRRITGDTLRVIEIRKVREICHKMQSAEIPNYAVKQMSFAITLSDMTYYVVDNLLENQCKDSQLAKAKNDLKVCDDPLEVTDEDSSCMAVPRIHLVSSVVCFLSI